MRAKVVFLDIDGTLYSQVTHCVPTSARRAVAALRARGVRVVVATGRHPLELDSAGLDGMTFDGFAASNGQMCLDGDRVLFSGHPIPDEGVRALAERFAAGETLWLLGERESYASCDGETIAALAELTAGVATPLRDYDGQPLYQAVAFVGRDEEAGLAAALPGCRLQRWAETGVDIIAEDGGKVAGMRAFLARFGATRKECVAFGDQHNDIEMLRFAGVGVAMGNATPEAKEAADLVTTAVDEDGLARALERLGLLEPGWEAR